MRDYHLATNQLRTTHILNTENESPTVKTFTFQDQQCVKAEPGQFIMLWIPGVDEIPLSILHAEGGGTVSVAVKKVGEATTALHNKKTGDVIGVRGPFGNSFTLQGGRILTVSGGTGTIPILFLVRKLVRRATKLTSVIGAKTKDELLFRNELQQVLGRPGMKMVSATEDGSYGVKGLVTKTLRPLLAEEEFDMIYTCGPERMMRRIFDLAKKHGIPLEASLERLMRCAIGLCGSCVVGRYRVCTDGPVFTDEQLREITGEFGVSQRGFDGRKIPLNSV